VCVGENCPLPLGGTDSVSIVSQSVAEWWGALGTRGEADGQLLLLLAGRDVGAAGELERAGSVVVRAWGHGDEGDEDVW